jgi:hypothetical protein
MTTKQLTRKFSTKLATEFKDSVANSNYYLFIGKSGQETVPVPNVETSEMYLSQQVYSDMIAGKKVAPADCQLVVKNIPYVSNVVYDMFDDTDPFLIDKDFFVIVNEGSYRHLYKCLDNNRGAYSTATPTFTHIVGSNTTVYQTSDGYRWKYMYSVSDADYLTYATNDYFPVVANSTVESAASNGSIDIFVVEGIGEHYDNYVVGTLSTSEIKIGGNTRLYQISNTLASTANGFYTKCLMYLTTGTGAGQFKELTNFFSNSSGKYAVVNSAFTVSPTNGTQYEITPAVSVYGTGANISNCVARALVNANSTNSVYRVEILDRGDGYTFVYSANVVANSIVGVTAPAEIRAINSPPDGHGKNPAYELYCNAAIISTRLANTESNTVLTTNDFQQFGIIANPSFANVVVQLANAQGSFLPNEHIYEVTRIRVQTNTTISTTTPNVSSNTGAFSATFVSGDDVFISSGDGSLNLLTTINSVTNSSQFRLHVNGAFSATDGIVYKPTKLANGIIKTSNGTHLTLLELNSPISAGSFLVGNTSGAVAYVNTVSRNDVSKYFDTFIQLHKYTGNAVSGTFSPDETVYQETLDKAQAILHTVQANSGVLTLYTSNQQGQFDSGGSNTIIGDISSAIMLVTNKYEPELIPGSGEVIMVENVESISRSANTSETFKIIIGL